jgi:hypothetical protein
MHPNCFKKVALLAEGSGGNGIAAKLFDEPGEPFGKTHWRRRSPHDTSP